MLLSPSLLGFVLVQSTPVAKYIPLAMLQTTSAPIMPLNGSLVQFPLPRSAGLAGLLARPVHRVVISSASPPL